ncbi:type IV secretion system protein VirB7 [Campylobacter jejuni]|nr:type IV secretion system protein VirB7 [Campylobacter jejuni]MCC2953917.1 type IV secretion system protein VirB7 [Campylobacter jejuni]MCC2965096.1 type IV secretion system protein VirB7 [Campylobacter jejuni]MCC2966939.1 type IV secretion system protein VirB7 [Campylobacter jejuni]MCC2968552.1 type IV secretion system protein VirB7 [Campylobacter jejuni]MCC2969380.1 type IV secretion system protein VirB7 [Campylobacter jejuni]
MKILKISILIITIIFFSACATTNKEIPKKSPCACNYDVIKIS